MTMIEPVFYMALTTGFLGSGHCIGMCGGLVTALAMATARQKGRILFQILYNIGRITTYTVAGAVLGYLGSVLAYTNLFHGAMRFALIGSDIFVIAIGLGSAGLFSRLNIMNMEFAAPARIVRRITLPLQKIPGFLAALPMGLAMGFLPCGFSYAMAMTAAQTASAATGALTMLFFGLGTAPALLLFGGAAQWLSIKARSRMLRCAGVMVAAIGAYNLIKHLEMLGWTLDGPLQFLCH